jgi:hypothetical protein
MCESKVYMAAAGGEQLVLEDVTTIRPESDGYRLVNRPAGPSALPHQGNRPAEAPHRDGAYRE